MTLALDRQGGLGLFSQQQTLPGQMFFSGVIDSASGATADLTLDSTGPMFLTGQITASSAVSGWMLGATIGSPLGGTSISRAAFTGSLVADTQLHGPLAAVSHFQGFLTGLSGGEGGSSGGLGEYLNLDTIEIRPRLSASGITIRP